MSTETLSKISAEQVNQYLTENPTFFLKHEHLLTDLYLPHASGEAVSLLDRQVSILRDRNIETRKRLNDMLEEGQRNDVLFQKTRTLVLDLLEARSLDDLNQRLVQCCMSEFQVDRVQLSLIDSPENYRNTQTRVIPQSEVEAHMPQLKNSKDCISGIFREEELKFLFAGRQSSTASGIALPLRSNHQLKAILVLGSDDPHYFKAGMDTLFLNFIGDVISRVIPRFMK
ncbi:MAG: DUF484 family protein [Pseudomonadales bacterium]|nr:DUF484 family protein [Pseudomonadales bacterium]